MSATFAPSTVQSSATFSASAAGSPASPSTAQALLTAIVQCDAAALRRLLSPDVWFRAMILHDVLERHDAEATIEVFQGWFDHPLELEVLALDTSSVTTRDRVRYLVRLRPTWAPDVWHVIEQSGYARIADGRVRRLDLVCTGFVPETS